MNYLKVVLMAALLAFTAGCGVDGLPVPPSVNAAE